jgi:hypothetical protein
VRNRIDTPPAWSRPASAVMLVALVLGLAGAGAAQTSREAGSAGDESEPSRASIRAPGEVELGVAFELEITLDQRAAREWLEVDEQALAPLVLRRARVTTRIENGRHVESRLYRAYAFVAGEIEIPSLTLAARAPDGAVHEAQTPPIRLTVTPALPPGPAGAPELPGEPLPQRGGVRTWIRPILVVLVLTALLAGITSLVVRRRRSMRPPAPPVAPDVLALERLARLRRDALTTSAGLESTMHELSEIVRAYLAARFSMRALEMTTEELERDATLERELTAEQRARVLSIGECCDRVQFAGFVIPPESAEDMLRAAERLIVKTRAGEPAVDAPRSATT